MVSAALLLAAALAGTARADGRPAPLPVLQAAIVEYRWTFPAPHWVVKPRDVAARVYAPSLRPARIDFGVLEVEAVRRKVARVADFSCKYSDFWLPNECRTTWRDVYIDVPVPALRNDYIEVDVPQWSWQQWRTTVEVPRLSWRQETLVVSLPGVAVGTAAR
jgi:hypothetical protein